MIRSALLLISRAGHNLGLTKFKARDGFAAKHTFLAGLQNGSSTVLEIGPFDQPTVMGPHVKYFDVMDQHGLMARAQVLGREGKKCPHIDYVSSNADLSVISEEKFDNVISSHCIEHQPDLIRHLNQVSNLLRPGGRYYLVVPDKRFTFDHSVPATRVSDVLAAHAEAREVHTAAAILYHYAETTHNNPLLHWVGLHRPLKTTLPYVERLRSAQAVISTSGAHYVDVHGWCFTPGSLFTILQTLSEMDMIDFEVGRVYGTLLGSGEFFAILEKASNGRH